jgi:hypothetical protein
MGDNVLAEFASAANAVELQQQMAVANDGASKDRRIAPRVCAEAKYPRSPRRRARIQDFRHRQQKQLNPRTRHLPRCEKQNRLHPCARKCVNL